MRQIKTPLTKKDIKNLRCGEEVLLSGRILTARDRAHKELVRLIKNLKKLPVDLNGQIIYYTGPTNTPKGKIIGSCGPTTSSRLDRFTPPLIKKGIIGMIGKGRRNTEIVGAIKKHKLVYFLAPSGLGALLSKKVIAKKCIAFKGLGPEAIYELKVKDFPLIVGIDSKGNDIFKRGKT